MFAPRFEARITESVADKRVEHVWCIDDDEQLEACMSFIDHAIEKLKAARELHEAGRPCSSSTQHSQYCKEIFKRAGPPRESE